MKSIDREPPPCGVGQRCEGVVDTIAFGGEGVVRHEGFLVLVPFVLPAERIEFEVTQVRRNFGRGRLIRVIEPSPHRVVPRCRHFGECGGCQYQHLAYDEQVRWKRRQVAELLQRLGGVDPDRVAPIIPCPQPYGYRNRIMVRSQWSKPDQRLLIGFLRHDNRWVVELEECPIAEPELSNRIAGVRANPPPKGGIKVTLRRLPEGWRVPQDSFFQTNTHLLPALVGAVRDRLLAAGNRWLLDLYCGVGFFALELAGVVERFVGVELDRMAIRAAEENARIRGVTNGEFLEAPAEAALPDMLRRFPPGETTLVIDPPRAGCAASLIECLAANGPAQVIYVSCHPATLARDVQRLVASGVYQVEQVVPLDMFPQTQHVECVADLRRAPGKIA